MSGMTVITDSVASHLCKIHNEIGVVFNTTTQSFGVTWGIVFFFFL